MDKHLIVVSVIEGRNIVGSQHSGSQYVYIEARFNNEILSSDPVPLVNTCPQFLTELCWELDRKCLHLFRIERKPIKLMCYSLNSDSLEKHFIGYIVLDIRLAQEVVKQKFEWKPLLNNKYRGPAHQRPELHLAIQLVKSNEQVDSDGTIPNGDQALATSVEVMDESRSEHDDHEFENDIRVMLSNGRYHIWDAKNDSEFDRKANYKLSVTIVFASNLYKLVKFPAKLEEKLMFHFNLNLFGSSVQTEAFTDLRSCEIPIEKISFKVTTQSAATLSTYFKLHPTLEIQLCDNKNEPLGFVTISLNRLYSKNEAKFSPIESQFRLLPYDDGISSDPPHPNIGVIVEVDEEEMKSSPTKYINRMVEELSREGTGSQQHYCFAVDIRSMSFTDEGLLPLKACFIQYSYAFFGFMDKIKTSVVAVDELQTIMFDEGFCAFNFATSESQLRQTLKSVPLILEVVEESTVNILLGTAKLYLSDILNVTQDNEEKRVLNFDVPVLNSNKDKIGEIQVIMCLQNWGEAKIGHLPRTLPQRIQGEDSHKDSAVNVDTLLMEAALEIEMWKEQQIATFSEDLKRKETEYLQLLENKYGNKTEEKEDEVHRKMTELLKLEERLKGLMEAVCDKERRLDSKESELSEKQVLLKARFEKLDNEISEAINDLKLNFEDKYNDAKEKLRASHEDKSRLQQKVYSLERKLKEKDEMIKDLQDKAKGVARPAEMRSKKSVGENEVKSLMKDTTSLKSHTRSVEKNSGLKKQNGMKQSQQTIVSRREITSNTKNEAKRKSTDKKTMILAQIKKEKEELLKRGIGCDDPIIKEIDSQLEKHGFKHK